MYMTKKQNITFCRSRNIVLPTTSSILLDILMSIATPERYKYWYTIDHRKKRGTIICDSFLRPDDK